MVGVLERLEETRGLPEVITVDNSPEFAGKAMDEWAYRRGIKLSFIRPGVIFCVCCASTGRGERWSPQDLDSLIAVTMLWGSVT